MDFGPGPSGQVVARWSFPRLQVQRTRGVRGELFVGTRVLLKEHQLFSELLSIFFLGGKQKEVALLVLVSTSQNVHVRGPPPKKKEEEESFVFGRQISSPPLDSFLGCRQETRVVFCQIEHVTCC